MPDLVTSSLILGTLVFISIALAFYIYRVKSIMPPSNQYKTFTAVAEIVPPRIVIDHDKSKKNNIVSAAETIS